MSKLHKVLLSAAVALSIVAVLIASNVNVPVLGSVGQSGEYFATSTKEGYTGATMADLQVISASAGTLGSVVITGLNTGNFCFYDATSTVTNAAWATSTLACFPTNAPAGTYTFDVNFQKGLLIDWTTNLATSTITWRAR